MIDHFIPSADFVVGGIFVGLVVAGIRAFMNRRRLYVIVPRMFSYSELSTSGQVVEITVTNKGTRTENDIEVKLAPNLTYEVVASTLPGLKIEPTGLLRIGRLAKSEDVSIVLTVEGGDFDRESVLSVNSQDTKGEITKQIADSQETTPLQAWLILLAIFVVLPGMGYFYGTIFVEEVWPELRLFSGDAAKKRQELVAEGWEEIDDFMGSEEYEPYIGDWPVQVKFPKRKGDLLIFEISFENKLSERVEFTASLSSAFDDAEYRRRYGRWPNTREAGILLLPGQSTTRSIEAYLPFAADTKVVVFEFIMEPPDEFYRFKYFWHFESPAG